MRAAGVVAWWLLLPALAGCVGDDAGGDGSAPASFPACEHPWPCADGSEWPADLVAPSSGFALAERMPLRAPMQDGVELDGAVWLPEVPGATRLPVVLWLTPYAGQCRDDPRCDEAPSDSDALGRIFEPLRAGGFAMAAFNMRGTGLSGGCFDFYGETGQRDAAALVEWLAAQPWSNGRVGMWGLSAMGTTPWMAAIHAPPALKAIAPSGMISDLYLNRFTPQGAPWLASGAFQVQWGTLNSPAPPAGALLGREVSQWPDLLARAAANGAARLCDDVREWETAGVVGQYTDDRTPAFWDERRLVRGFPNVTAAVLIQQGFHDEGHAFQEDAVWPALAGAPRRMVAGPWGHELFYEEHLGEYAGGAETVAVLLEWFGFWLKGIGEPPRVGVVDYLAEGGAWGTADAWPPSDARSEVLHLADARLQPNPGAGGSIVATPGTLPPTPAGCAIDREAAARGGSQLTFLTEPLETAATIAGNPMGWLDLTSDQPGGMVALDLYALEADGNCRLYASHGAADLRFHAGNGRGEPFPTGTSVGVRLDLWGTAFRVGEGERLLVVVSASGADGRAGAPYAPRLEIGGTSHLVLPLVEGTLGGGAPTQDYPPRPFV